MASTRQAMGIRPTHEGVATFVLTVAVTGVAFGGNNLVFIVMCLLWALWAVTLVTGPRNVKNISVERRLPYEVFAGVASAGSFELRSRRWGFGLLVGEQDGGASAGVRMLEPGHTRRILARWRFARRGMAELTGVRVSSRFPFGMIEWVVDLQNPVSLVVYPRPRAGGRLAMEDGQREAEANRSTLDRGMGDFVGLRAWRNGEAIKNVHWRTSARVGEWMCVDRGVDVAKDLVHIRLEGDDLERALCRASGQVVSAFESGCTVRLDLGDAPMGPGNGGRWRSQMLTALALYEVGSGLSAARGSVGP